MGYDSKYYTSEHVSAYVTYTRGLERGVTKSIKFQKMTWFEGKSDV